MSFNDWLSRQRLYAPQRIAVVDDQTGRRYSYAELQDRASRLAASLQLDQQINPGDRIACLSTNRIECIDLYFACGKIGAVLVPINYRLPASAVIELLEDCEPKLLVYEATFESIANEAGKVSVVSQQALIDQFLETLPVRHVEGFESFTASESDTAMILYTSGTTGRAKGAMITYRQIHWNAMNTTIGLQLTRDDVAFLNMPLYHTGGWHVLFSPLMMLGGRVILQSKFDAQRCNELVGDEGITILFGVPTMLRMMLEAPNFRSADLSSIRLAIFGGESCPLSTIRAFGDRDVPMRQGYGLTEAGPNCFSLPANDAIRKQGSIGFPNFHVGVRLRRDDQSEAGVDEVGELLMSGPHLFAGYWRQPEETAATLQQGWLATGDLMRRDDEGYYYVVGRKKEMYVSGGENVYPAQVERILQGHPLIVLAAVVGIPDPKWGETGIAFIQLQPGQKIDDDALRSWSKQHLATFQLPAKFVIMQTLPVGPTGKIDKLELARQARIDAER